MQSGYLSVVVPPDILNPESGGAESEMLDAEANEGGTISLSCRVTGIPMPTVTWRRELGKSLVFRADGRERQVMKHVDGEKLTLTNVQRSDMGGYLCIASNGVPPSVSKRFEVLINCR